MASGNQMLIVFTIVRTLGYWKRLHAKLEMSFFVFQLKKSDVPGDEEVKELKRENSHLHEQLREKEKEIRQLNLVIDNLTGTNIYYIFTIYGSVFTYIIFVLCKPYMAFSMSCKFCYHTCTYLGKFWF